MLSLHFDALLLVPHRLLFFVFLVVLVFVNSKDSHHLKNWTEKKSACKIRKMRSQQLPSSSTRRTKELVENVLKFLAAKSSNFQQIFVQISHLKNAYEEKERNSETISRAWFSELKVKDALS